MKKKVLLSMFVLIFIFRINAQEIKTFKGELKGGTQSYTYFEDDNGNFIKNGKYNYSKKEKGLVYNITGEFKDGKREGVWKFNITFTNWGDYNNQYLGYKKMSMSYFNGFPNGICKYTSELQIRYSKYVNGIKQWGSYDKKAISNLTFNFKKGILVGEFNINDGISKETVSGKFNNQSLADGFFIYIDNIVQTKTTATYKNGVVITFNKVDLNSGKSEYNLKNDSIVFKLCNDLANNKIKYNELPKTDKNYYSTDTVHSIAPIKSSLKTFIYQDDFLFYEIGGDLNYNNGEIKYGGNKAVIIEKYGYQVLGEDYSFANQKFENREYQSALEGYQKILSKNEYLSEKDKNLVLEKIKICKNKVKEIEVVYNKMIMSADSLFNIGEYDKSIKKYEESFDFAYNLKINSETSKSKMSEAKKLLGKQKEEIVNISNININKIDKIDKSYIVVDKILTQTSGTTKYKTKKKKLYNGYKIVLQDFQMKIDAEKDNVRKIKLLQEESVFFDRIINLSKVNTKDLEKILKNKTDANVIKKIIMS